MATAVDFSHFKLRTDVPPQRRVAAYLKAVIALGHLSPGDPLPGPSALAGRIGVPLSAVRKASLELGERGFLESEGTRWRVSDEHAAVGDMEEVQEICERMWDLVTEARRAGMTRTELQRMFQQLLGRS